MQSSVQIFGNHTARGTASEGQLKTAVASDVSGKIPSGAHDEKF